MSANRISPAGGPQAGERGLSLAPMSIQLPGIPQLVSSWLECPLSNRNLLSDQALIIPPPPQASRKSLLQQLPAPVLERPRQEGQKFKATLAYVRPYLNKERRKMSRRGERQSYLMWSTRIWELPGYCKLQSKEKLPGNSQGGGGTGRIRETEGENFWG